MIKKYTIFCICRRRKQLARYRRHGNRIIQLQSGIGIYSFYTQHLNNINSLILLLAPSIDSEMPDLHTEVSEEVAIKIDISGVPVPDITWYFNSQIIAEDTHYELEDDTVLLIHDIQLKHAGIYNFTASNPLGEASGRVRLFVEGINEQSEDIAYAPVEASCSVPLERWVGHIESLLIDGRYKEQFQVFKLGILLVFLFFSYYSHFSLVGMNIRLP